MRSRFYSCRVLALALLSSVPATAAPDLEDSAPVERELEDSAPVERELEDSAPVERELEDSAPKKPPAAAATHAPATHAPVDQVRPWIGTWIFDEDRAKKQTEIRAAVKVVTDEVPFFLESYVSNKLLKSVNIAPGVDVSATGKTIRTKYMGASTFEGPLNAWVHANSADVEIDVQFQEKGKRLHQHFRADNGGRKQTLRVLPNGRLRVDVEVYSKWLPKPLLFSLEYRRKK